MGDNISGIIIDYFRERGIYLEEYSDYVNNNKLLGKTEKYSYYRRPVNSWSSIGTNSICLNMSADEIRNEHLFPIISKLISLGFTNIIANPMYDAGRKTGYYPFQIEDIIIDGNDRFDKYSYFRSDSIINIYYHEVRKKVLGIF